MPPKKKTPSVTRNTSGNSNIVIGRDVNGILISGNNNTVDQTIIQKIFNIFNSDAETLEQRNRRILLGHVENFWVKGVLEKSLHGTALLELGIKEDPDAVKTYPWAIKKEETNETLPTGTSMLEIFDSIGMRRSLLILGAPGSGKTTMLLELARQLIARARQDVTEPIPIVFNLASWTEKLSLADWLAEELNAIYSVPLKTEPDWLNGNNLLFLLDGLDEIQQENRAKCVESINEFRKEYGFTSLAVCSRSQDYVDIKSKLAFEGAIEVQPLTKEHIKTYVGFFGNQLSAISMVLEEDTALREMAITPLFLSTMVIAYQNRHREDILVSDNRLLQRRYLFNAYSQKMLARYRPKGVNFSQHNILHWLSWIASRMIENGQITYYFENMQPYWIKNKEYVGLYKAVLILFFGIIGSLFLGLMGSLFFGLTGTLLFGMFSNLIAGLIISGLIGGSTIGLIVGIFYGLAIHLDNFVISTVDSFFIDWSIVRSQLKYGSISGLLFGAIPGALGINSTALLNFEAISGAVITNSNYVDLGNKFNSGLESGLFFGLPLGLLFGMISGLISGLSTMKIEQLEYSGQRLFLTIKNSLFAFFFLGIPGGLIGALIGKLVGALTLGLLIGLLGQLYYGGYTLIQHFTLRFFLARNNFLPWRLVPFLDDCVDLIFLRRVGGGYIFIHRLLMEHFAEMYKEEE